MKIKSFWLIFFGTFIIGCASIAPVPFNGPNGKQGYSMRCSGLGRTLDACYQKAGEVCPTGYNIVDRPSGTVGFINQGTMMMAPQNGLVIECK